VIVVTGANGQLGRRVVDGLLAKLPSAQIGVSVRDPAQAEALGQRGVRVCQGDFTDPASLTKAFDGAEQVLIISGVAFGEEGVRQHGNAIRAAKDAGVKRIVYTSDQAASPSATFDAARAFHAPTEALLESSGVPYVSLRNGFYAELAFYQLGDALQTGKIVLPEDGKVSWTARADLAQAAVAALTQPGLFDGVSPPLTGSQALDFTDIAKIASELLGRNIVRETVSDEEYRRVQKSQALPEEMVSSLLNFYTASRTGEFAVVDPTLERLLNRPPTTMKEVLNNFLLRPAAQS
jgi:NAD(P)H dehydrogenase (quinone)